MKRLLIVLLPLALAGCVTERAPTLPMALGPSVSPEAACLTYGDSPTFGECETLKAGTTE